MSPWHGGGIQIGELSRRTGGNIETIRYYERIGPLPAPARSAGRYRIYDPADVRRLAFIRRARELGLTLDEVRTLLKLSANDGQGACTEVRELAARYLGEVRAKIAACGLWSASWRMPYNAALPVSCRVVRSLTHSRQREFSSRGAIRSAVLLYLSAATALHLVWETAQLPRYTIWSTGTSFEILFAVSTAPPAIY